ncbi:MAG TPA: hypothetical protein VMY99_04970 [Nevskiaceae bacterium]|nr:hypothetical protein [Nevskiaceae bacterium]
MKTATINQDFALVLQHIKESGEEDLTGLSESLRFDRRRLGHIVQALQHKGLIVVSRDAWIRLSRKGQRVIRFYWPEAASKG